MPRIILLNSILHRAGEDLLAGRAQVEIVPAAAPPDRLTQALRDADGVLVRLPARITRGMIAAAPRLRVIGTAGAGYDNIDVAAATEAGIPVVNNAGVGPNPVAEHTVGLMRALARRIVAGDRRLRRDGWACRERLLGAELGTELSGKTVGVVGFGFIGRRVAAICTAAFGSRALAYDPFLEDAVFAAAGVERRRDLPSSCQMWTSSRCTRRSAMRRATSSAPANWRSSGPPRT